MGTLIQDVRYASRTLRKNPGFTAVAVLTLALGIGANTAIFSVVNAVLLRPLPYRDAEQLVMVWEQLRNLGVNQFAAPFADYEDYKQQNRFFSEMAAFEYSSSDLSANGEADRVQVMRVTASLFPLLGARAALGRAFAAGENQPGRANVAVLSGAFWKRRFGADRGVIGKSVSLDGELLTVVGVMPQEFRFSDGTPTLPEVWAPILFRPDPNRTAGQLHIIARLKRGMTLEQAQVEMGTVAERLEKQYHLYRGPHGEDAGYTVAVIPLREQLFGNVRHGLLVMLCAVGLVLLIACANVTNLMLAKVMAREQEMAVRLALGAGRGRLVLQLLVEGSMLALLGGAAGLLMAFLGTKLLAHSTPPAVSAMAGIGIDHFVLLITLVVSLATGIVFALPPALEVSNVDLQRCLKEGSRIASPRSRFRDVVVIAEIALSLPLAVSAGLLIRSFERLLSVDPGFNPERLVTARISLPRYRYDRDYQVAAFYQHLVDQIERLPGVTSASVTSFLPLTAGRGGDPFSIEGRPWQPFAPGGATPQVADYIVVSPSYFQTLQIPLLAGRAFTERDGPATPSVAVVDQMLARAFWPGENAIGKRILMGAPRLGAPWLTIVGVVGDVKMSGLDVTPVPQIYASDLQSPSATMSLLVRTTSDPMLLEAQARHLLADMDPDRALFDLKTMEQVLDTSTAPRRTLMLELSVFAFLAVILAAGGIYGVAAYSVSARTHEIGVRMALGARRSDVLRLVVGQGLRLLAIGVGLGLLGALALTRFVAGLLYGVRRTDPVTLAGVSLLLVVVALLASYIPARRATKVDPMVALRYE